MEGTVYYVNDDDQGGGVSEQTEDNVKGRGMKTNKHKILNELNTHTHMKREIHCEGERERGEERDKRIERNRKTLICCASLASTHFSGHLLLLAEDGMQ